MGKVKVKILGNEYTLKGDNEALMRQASLEVENQLTKIMEKYKDESLQTIFTLTAINLAEKLKECELQSKADTEFIIDELKKITLYLIENIHS
ncbi:cell division protein ZapA [Bacteroidetes/Chlorobi group bacterium MS-B_bin-24]|jgi:cell division protein ZapA (FtsZ GTPase activity inhibitor)|nr:MAG: cell division protein ZapA [Bacteroidetes/Chlorobi group bacterium MS-B_bin-24]